MIGIFDSGFGGLTIIKDLIEDSPQYSYVYLGDNKRAPYGPRSDKEIFKFTLEGVEELFRQGCEIIILACNTASSVALRRIQQEILPSKYPDKKVLGIIIPTAEESESFSKNKHIGIWATEATVKSGVYSIEVLKIDPGLEISELACPDLAPLIEKGDRSSALEKAITKCIRRIIEIDKEIDTLVLGCTHYPLVESDIRELLPPNIRLITQGKIIAKKLKKYLDKHQEIDRILNRKGRRLFLTTDNSKITKRVAEKFYGQEINFKIVNFY